MHHYSEWCNNNLQQVNQSDLNLRGIHQTGMIALAYVPCCVLRSEYYSLRSCIENNSWSTWKLGQILLEHAEASSEELELRPKLEVCWMTIKHKTLSIFVPGILIQNLNRAVQSRSFPFRYCGGYESESSENGRGVLRNLCHFHRPLQGTDRFRSPWNCLIRDFKLEQ